MNSVPVTSSTEQFVLSQFQIWGSFSLVVILLLGVIWWLLYTNRVQRASFLKVIDDEKSERKEWQATAFTLTREMNDQALKSFQSVKEVNDSAIKIIDFIKEQDRNSGQTG